MIEKRDGEWCLLSSDGSKVLGCHPTKAEAEAQERAIEAANNVQQFCMGCGMPAAAYAPFGKLFDELLAMKESDVYHLISTLNDSIHSVLNDGELSSTEKAEKLKTSLAQFLEQARKRLTQLNTFAAAQAVVTAFQWSPGQKRKAGASYMEDDEIDPKTGKPVQAMADDEEIDPDTGLPVKKAKRNKKRAMAEGDDEGADEELPPDDDTGKEGEPTFSLKGVEIFATGTHNGDKYSNDDLDEMVDAFKVQGFIPPLKAGHDETPGRPALGWVSNLRRAGGKLLADFTHMPQDVYQLIKRRGYDRVSSEIYWNLKSGGKTFRRALKAVALLGADVPAVTSLAPLHTLFSGLEGVVKFYDGGKGMATSEKETLAALSKQVADLHAAIGGSSGGGSEADPMVVRQLSQITDQIRLLEKRISETAQAEQRVLSQSEELEKAHKRIEALEEDQRRGRILKIVDEVRIPAFRPYFQALLDIGTRESRVVKFSKRDGKEEEMSVERLLKAFIQEINDGASKLFRESMASAGNHRTRSGEDLDLEDRQAVANYVDAKAREFMAENRLPESSYKQALQSVLNREPELKAAYTS